MCRKWKIIAVFGVFVFTPGIYAGIYNRAEPAVPLNGDLMRFFSTLAELRGYGPPDEFVGQDSARRKDYLEKAQVLRAMPRLTVEEKANLGAYLIRLRRTGTGLPDFEEAVQVLEAARSEHPGDFYILANLGTAYQLTGRLDAAVRCLMEAVSLVPDEHRTAERYHLRLVQQRMRERLRPGLPPLDELLQVRFQGDSGAWEIGAIAESEKSKLPPDAIAIVQQLLVWLPDDGRLHWLLGELANAHGDVRAAHKAMDLAVDQFRLSTSDLRKRRQLLKEAAAKQVEPPPDLSAFDVDEEAEETTPEPSVGILERLGGKGLAIVAGGGVVILVFLALQIREMRRRRGKGGSKSSLKNIL